MYKNYDFSYDNSALFSYPEQNIDALSSESEECFGEKMVYTLKMNDSRIIRGKKFNCSLTWLLERYKLSDKYAIKEKIEVSANDFYYPSLRTVIANVKKTFGCKQKIIAYDLGTITKNKEWMSELDSVCNFEWRIFDFSQMVEGRVRHPKSYAWKIFVWAHVLLEYDTVVWIDTSVVFYKNDFKRFFEPMENGKIGTVQNPSFASHGMNISTHPGMYEFLPMYTNFEPNKTYELTGIYKESTKTDPPQFETNFVIMHKSEQTRQMMKW
ncbi:hypothetical protein niasHT_011839 [Heterodera trifolii]|uniref:Nucleotide-diphospho-sugar transferase domain-containing protein n=1 Tax=Heterodera trifolii TaxID=157864 RepID=A0ABD2L5F5_9BILA